MREVYLDFYSKSLLQQETYPAAIIFSKRLQIEQLEHNKILQELTKCKNVRQYLRSGLNKDDLTTEGGHGIEDI